LGGGGGPATQKFIPLISNPQFLTQIFWKLPKNLGQKLGIALCHHHATVYIDHLSGNVRCCRISR
jgi:hypothetical protein